MILSVEKLSKYSNDSERVDSYLATVVSKSVPDY